MNGRAIALTALLSLPMTGCWFVYSVDENESEGSNSPRVTDSSSTEETAAATLAEPPPPATTAPARERPIYRVGGEVTPPVVTKRVTPDFSSLEGTARRWGVHIVEAVIDETGRVESVRTRKSSGAAVERLVADAVRQWTFEPARRRGVPVAVYFTLTVNIDPR